MAHPPIRTGALLLLPAVLAYLLVGVVTGGLARLVGSSIVVLAALSAAFVGSLLLEGLAGMWRQARRAPIDSLRRELAVQTSALGVAGVLVSHLQRLTGATAVVLLFEHPSPVVLGAPAGEPTCCLTLELSGQKVGELRCYGSVRLADPLPCGLRVGALALHNAILAERAALAERASYEAQAQRDLQYRLTWTVTTQVRTLLEETRERLEIVRLCAQSMPPDLLTRDLGALTERLCQLEAFVHDNLRNAKTVQGPIPDGSLAGLARPR